MIFKRRLKLQILLCLIVFSIFFCSCGYAKKDSLPSFDQLPTKYTGELAIKNGDVVRFNGRDYHVEKLDRFYKNANEKKDDQIRVTNYAEEGGAVIMDLVSKSGRITLSIDSSRDTPNGIRNKDAEIEIYNVKSLTKEKSKNAERMFYSAVLENGQTLGLF